MSRYPMNRLFFKLLNYILTSQQPVFSENLHISLMSLIQELRRVIAQHKIIYFLRKPIAQTLIAIPHGASKSNNPKLLHSNGSLKPSK